MPSSGLSGRFRRRRHKRFCLHSYNKRLSLYVNNFYKLFSLYIAPIYGAAFGRAFAAPGGAGDHQRCGRSLRPRRGRSSTTRGIVAAPARAIATTARRSGVPGVIAAHGVRVPSTTQVESRKSLIVGESLGVGESPESRSAAKVEKPLRVDLRRHLPESRITTAEKPKHSLKTPLESLLEVFASRRRHKKTPLGSPKGVYRSFSGVSESGSRG